MSERSIQKRTYRAPARPGHLAIWKHVVVYVLLGVLVVADYLLLHQSLLMLNRAASASGPIGGQLYLVTAGFSVMMIALPHVAAIVGRRMADGLLPRSWKALLIFIGIVWLGVLVLVTAMRVSASVDAPSDIEIAAGITSSGVDLLGPESLMAYLTAFFLTATGTVSFVLTFFTSRPLLVALEQGEKVENASVRLRDAARVALSDAERDLEAANGLDSLDSSRLEIAKDVVDERLARLRSEIFTVIAENESDPRVTSHLMRELNARRDHLSAVPRTSLEDVG